MYETLGVGMWLVFDRKFEAVGMCSSCFYALRSNLWNFNAQSGIGLFQCKKGIMYSVHLTCAILPFQCPCNP